ncbi:MAG: serine hydrolase [Candidatus Oleimicrobiaceae bacterium]
MSTMTEGSTVHRAWYALCVFLALPGTVRAQQGGPYADAIKAYRAFVQQQMTIDGIPGLSVGFAEGDFQWAEGFGYADVENRTPATPHTSYRLASNTKSMTAVAILQLADEGRVELDAEVQRYVPYFPRKPWPVTVRQLLGHLGGISHYRNYQREGHIKEHKDTREAIAIFADFDLVAEPGTRYHYSSYGYNLLGAVIEGAAKQRYGDYLYLHLWQPLGMGDTRMDDPDELIANRARGYRMVDGQLRNSEFVDISSRFAAGGTRSTVLDMLKYARGLDSGRLLSAKSLEAMYMPMTTRDGRSTDYGMGWVVRPFNGHFCVYHTGGQPETRTLLFRLPRLDFALALAYNFEGADLFVYADRLLQLVLEERRIRIYAGAAPHQAICSALTDVFDYGFAYFERYGRPMSSDSAALTQAFAYLNRWACVDSLRKDYKAARQRLQDGRHPLADGAFVLVGSHMAHVLAAHFGSKALERYHKDGPLPFVADYVRTQKARGDFCALSPELEQLVQTWAKDWTKTWTPSVRQMVFAPFADMQHIEALRAQFGGATVYPDFVRELGTLTQAYVFRREDASALRTAQLDVALYPEAPQAWLVKCLADLCAGQNARAKEDLRRARDKDADRDVVTPSALSELAARLVEAGCQTQAVALLELAIAEMPREPALYAAMADIHLHRARTWLQQAIEVDPTYEAARGKLSRLP